MKRDEFLAMLREQEASYDPTLCLVRAPLTATYHTALKPDTHPTVHPLLGGTVYAYQLLQAGDEASAGQAADILRGVLAHQDRDPSRDTYGIWPYFQEESLNEMDRPDWNMADFHGKLLCQILKRRASLLPEPLVAEIRRAIHHACRAIIKRDVGPGYTNIAIMGAFVTLAGGELLGDEEIRRYGLARLERFYRYTMEIGTFSEYNSPCYTPIAIRELHAILTDSATPEAREFARELTDLAWRMTAMHYHAPTAAWGGPHSRTYDSLLRPDERRFLAEAMLDETFEYGDNIRCPRPYRSLFRTSEERYFAERTLLAEETGYQIHAATYQDETLTLGTFSQGVMWNQRRNLLAYVDAGGRAVYVQLQFLMDGRDFCSAHFAGAQDRTRALFGFRLLTDNGAWHSDLDQIHGKCRARDLRIRLKVGGDAEGLETPAPGADRSFLLLLGGRKLAVRPIFERFDEGALAAESGRGEDGSLHLDYVVYSGEERAFDFHGYRDAAWLFALALDGEGRPPESRIEASEGAVKATFADDGRISVETGTAPGATRDAFAATRVRHPLFQEEA